MNPDKVMIITSRSRGGVAQYALFLAKELKNNQNVNEVVLLVPDDNEYSAMENVRVCLYKKVVTKKPSESKFEMMLSKIKQHGPTHIIFAETSTHNLQLAAYIKDDFHISIVLHDALYRSKASGIVKYLGERQFEQIIAKNIHMFNKIIVLSEAVKNELNERYNIDHHKIMKINLCSHLNITSDIRMRTIVGDDYFLFFGRIEKYKGIETLLKAYKKDLSGLLPKLVIAGEGEFTKAEKVLLAENKRQVVVIKKYITDATLASLINHSKAVILPYVNATQSGVIPLAYQFGRPVVVSDLEGLTEHVVEDETGFIFPPSDSGALYNILKKLMITTQETTDMVPKIKSFYEREFNWADNINTLVEGISEG